MAEELKVLQGAGKNPFKSPRPPKEDDNTLKSKTIGRIIDLLAYGPIKGVVGGEKGVYLEDTPLKHGDDDYNFKGVRTEFREGYPDQEYIKGFAAVETPVEVGVEVTQDNPVVRGISSSDVDAVRVTVKIPSLVSTNDKGDRKEASLPLAISVRKDSGPWETRISETIKGKNTAPYTRSYRIDFYGEGNYEVRVERRNKESDKAKLQDTLIFDHFVEIIDSRLSYPGCALVAIEVDAEDFGTAIPKRGYLTDLRIIKVPSNYDPETRQYTGIWDGTFKEEWSDNPAWCFYDLATDPFIGAGLKNINKWELYEIGRYCDELVDDGHGGKEPRFTFNTYIQSQSKAIEALGQLASVFRGMVYWASNTVEVVADRPAPVKRIFSPADVIDGEFTYVGTSLDDRNSVVTVMWNDPDEDYEQVPEVVEDPESIVELGYKETEITAFACASRGQARRLGKWLLYSERMETETVSFKMPVQFFDLRPGDIFQVSDPYRVGERLHGRILKLDGNELTLDETREDLVGWDIILNKEDGTLYQGEILSHSEDVIEVTGSLLGVVPGSSYVLVSSEIVPAQYRVLSVKEEAGDVYAVEAVSHHPGKYAFVEEGLELPEIPSSNIRTDRLDPPDEIVAETFTYDIGEGQGQGISVGWSAPRDPRIDEYVFEYRSPSDENYQLAYVGPDLGFDIRDIDPSIPGFWSFRVMSRGEFWPQSIWREINNVEIQNRLIPLKPTGLIFSSTIRSILIRPQFEVAGVAEECEFYRSTRQLEPHESVEDNSVLVGTNYIVEDTNLPYDTEFHYYVRGVNRYGKSDFYYASASTDDNVDEILEFITDETKQTGLGKYLGDEIEKISGVGEGSVNDRVEGVKSELEGSISDTRAELEGMISSSNETLGQRIDDLGLSVDEKLEDIDDLLQMLEGLDLWHPGEGYLKDSVVQYEGALFKAKKDVPAGIVPEEGEYWEEIGSIQTILADINDVMSEVEEIRLVQEGLALTSNRLSARLVEYDEDEDEYLKSALDSWDIGADITEVRRVVAAKEQALVQRIDRMRVSFGELVSGEVANLQELIATESSAIYQEIDRVGLEVEDNTASIDRVEQLVVDETEAIYSELNRIDLEFIDVNEDISSVASAVESLEGAVDRDKAELRDTYKLGARFSEEDEDEDEVLRGALEDWELGSQVAVQRIVRSRENSEFARELVRLGAALSQDIFATDSRLRQVIATDNEARFDFEEETKLQFQETKADLYRQQVLLAEETSAIYQEIDRVGLEVEDNTASIDRVEQLVVDETEAIYTRLEEIELEIDEDVTAKIQDILDLDISSDTALAMSLDSLSLAVGDNTSSLTSILDLSVDPSSSLGKLITQLDVTSEGQSATIETLQEVVTGEDGLSSQWGMKLETIRDAGSDRENRVITGMTLISDQNKETPPFLQSAVMFRTNSFIVVPEGYDSVLDLEDASAVKDFSPFSIVEGKVVINTAMIDEAAIRELVISGTLKSKGYDTSGTGWMLDVNSGSFHIKSAGDGGSMEMTGDGIVIKEGTKTRVKLGNLSKLV